MDFSRIFMKACISCAEKSDPNSPCLDPFNGTVDHTGTGTYTLCPDCGEGKIHTPTKTDGLLHKPACICLSGKTCPSPIDWRKRHNFDVSTICRVCNKGTPCAKPMPQFVHFNKTQAVEYAKKYAKSLSPGKKLADGPIQITKPTIRVTTEAWMAIMDKAHKLEYDQLMKSECVFIIITPNTIPSIINFKSEAYFQLVSEPEAFAKFEKIMAAQNASPSISLEEFIGLIKNQENFKKFTRTSIIPIIKI